MRIVGAMLLMAGGVLLAGCETGPAMSPAQCQVADWRGVGFQDGSEGRPAERYVALEQACVAAGMGADQQAYMRGRTEGLWNYCQPDRAFRLGVAGTGYNGVCPAELDGVFRDAHSDGMRAYTALSALRSAEGRISSLRNDREDVERKLDANEAGLIASTTDADRERHRNEVIRLRNERNRIDDEIRDADRDQRDENRAVQRLRGELGFRYGNW